VQSQEVPLGEHLHSFQLPSEQPDLQLPQLTGVPQLLTTLPHCLPPQVVDCELGTQGGTYPQLVLLGMLLWVQLPPEEQV